MISTTKSQSSPAVRAVSGSPSRASLGAAGARLVLADVEQRALDNAVTTLAPDGRIRSASSDRRRVATRR
jgi:uncharacterized membrane protein